MKMNEQPRIKFSSFFELFGKATPEYGKPLEIQFEIHIDDVPCVITLWKSSNGTPSVVHDMKGIVMLSSHMRQYGERGNEMNHENPEPTYTYSYNITHDGFGGFNDFQNCIYTNTLDDLFQDIYEFCQGTYVGRLRNIRSYSSIMMKGDFEKYKSVRNTFLQVQNKEEKECYVCYHPTHGHQTKCGHDICAKCFYKSLQQCDCILYVHKYHDDEDEESGDEGDKNVYKYKCGLNKVKFQCGICRNIERDCVHCLSMNCKQCCE